MTALVLGLALLAGTAFAEPKMPTQPVTLEYWTIFTGPDGKVMQQMVDAFNKEYSGKIKVNMSVMPAADYYVKMPIAIQGGKGPDVGICHLDSIKKVLGQGVLLPIDVASMGIKDGDILPVAWKAAQVGGKQYGIPLDVHPLVFFWNKKLFKEAGLDPEKVPATREEFLKVAKALTKDTNGDGKADQWGTAIPVGWPNFQIWYSILFQNDGDIFSADLSKSVYNSPEGRDAAQFLVDLITKYNVSPANVQVDADVDMFKRGTAAMEFNGIWMLDGYKNTAGLDFGAAPIPQLGSKKAAEWAGSHNLVLFKQKSPNADKLLGSQVFLNYISNKSLTWAGAGQVPARLTVQASAEFKAIPFMKAVGAGTASVVFPDLFPKFGDATGPVWEALNLSIIGKKTVDQAFADAAKLSDQLLKE